MEPVRSAAPSSATSRIRCPRSSSEGTSEAGDIEVYLENGSLAYRAPGEVAAGRRLA